MSTAVSPIRMRVVPVSAMPVKPEAVCAVEPTL